ncbi:MAG: choice-of-anchor D domain-containing protein [Myxococcales bacterium]|nr:choice-of-anchor D domain-containing protein [Myxococcales bacterium]MCB9534178.1 choice-of-anchor D domain-containing protein [Myxococcales bacterium]
MSVAFPARLRLGSLAVAALSASIAACGADARLYVEDAIGFDTGRGRTDADSSTQTDVEREVGRDAGGGRDTAIDEPGDDAPRDSGDLEPACAVLPARVEFDERTVGDTSEVVFRIENCGGFAAENLLVESLAIDVAPTGAGAEAFTMSGNPDLPFSILPNESWPFQVRFSPTAAGEYVAVVRIGTNDPAHRVTDVPIHASAR